MRAGQETRGSLGREIGPSSVQGSLDIAEGLLSGTSVDVIKHINSRCDCIADADPTSDSHPARCDRGRLWSMIDRGDHRRVKKSGLRGGWVLPHHHEPDHLGKAWDLINSIG